MGGARGKGCAALLAALMTLAAGTVTASAKAWEPEPASYGVGSQMNVPVTMKDGTVLSADVYFPTESSGAAAKGPFPVIMVQNPYAKNASGYASGREGGGEGSTEIGEGPYLVQRGYIDVVADVRGTGGSGGSFQILDPQQGKDGAELVHWAAKLPNSNGRVGLYGPSYMGLDQFMTAHALAAEGGDSPLKARFPIVTANDVYRDLAFMGGMPGAEFDVELRAGHAAHEREVAVDVVGGDDREPRLQRRVAALGGQRVRRHELVEAHVRGAVEPDPAVAVGQLGRPVDELGAVLALLRVEDLKRAARPAGPAHVGDDVDVAALDEVGPLADLGAPLAAALAARRVARGVLGVRVLDHDHRERPLRGRARHIGREVDVGGQDRAVLHRHRHVHLRAHPVARRLRLPGLGRGRDRPS